jgi:hypothetical protein
MYMKADDLSAMNLHLKLYPFAPNLLDMRPPTESAREFRRDSVVSPAGNAGTRRILRDPRCPYQSASFPALGAEILAVCDILLLSPLPPFLVSRAPSCACAMRPAK